MYTPGAPKCSKCGCYNPPPLKLEDGSEICRSCDPTAYETATQPNIYVGTSPKKRFEKKRRLRARLLTPTQWAALSQQGGTCFVCGVPGWGTVKGQPLKMGIRIRSMRGGKFVGIACRPCAAVLLKGIRPKMRSRNLKVRGRGSDGPGDQGGSRSE